MKTLELETPQAWRAWLEKHHESETEIWLVFPKRHTGQTAISYEDAINQALINTLAAGKKLGLK